MSDNIFEIVDTHPQEAVIKVIGVGGCGGNAVDHMIAEGIEGVEFICANTDSQALQRNKSNTLLQLGATITKGLGAGANPIKGRESAEEDRERIIEAIENADMLFLTAGMGGGTGTGAAPIVAKAARELGILTVAVVTKPFEFEGDRPKVAKAGLEELAREVDSLIVIPNDKLMEVLGDDVTMLDAFKAANSVLHGAVSGIAEVIKCPGMVNVDFADVRTVMSENKQHLKEIRSLRAKLVGVEVMSLMRQSRDVAGISVLVEIVENADSKDLRDFADQVRSRLGKGIFVLASVEGERASLVAGVTRNLTKSFNASDILKYIADQADGKGGGRPDMAQGSVSDLMKLPSAMESVYEWIKATV